MVAQAMTRSSTPHVSRGSEGEEVKICPDEEGMWPPLQSSRGPEFRGLINYI